VDHRPNTNAVILLDMAHTLRENAHGRNRENKGNLKLNVIEVEYSNPKLAEATMRSGLGSSEEVW
jgi:hypothetical protein